MVLYIHHIHYIYIQSITHGQLAHQLTRQLGTLNACSKALCGDHLSVRSADQPHRTSLVRFDWWFQLKINDLQNSLEHQKCVNEGLQENVDTMAGQLRELEQAYNEEMSQHRDTKSKLEKYASHPPCLGLACHADNAELVKGMNMLHVY